MKEKTTQEIQFIEKVNKLNSVIIGTNVANCYDKALEFFSITSDLHDNLLEIESFPLNGWEFLGIKSKKRKIAETARSKFAQNVIRAGRSTVGPNRTSRGEEVTKYNLFFGNSDDGAIPIKLLEKDIDPHLQQSIRIQISNFIESFEGKFDISWLV